MTDNLAIWNAIGKTDPNHTKDFKRGGGFSGTSVKPMWVLKRLTEQFGPAGIGFGVNEPKFELVHSSEGEVLVYCTVSAWHGSKDNLLWGVGGDKAIANNKHGLFHDDEAFKKAFTDAVNNAFKTIGVAADIHMGLYDDDKYVARMEREFAPRITEDQRTELMALLDATGFPVGEFQKVSKITDLRDLPADKFDGAKGWITEQSKKEAA